MAKKEPLPFSALDGEPQQWTKLIAQEFAGVDLGDERLKHRCQKVAQAMGKNPDKSIPEACGDWASTQGAYRFFANEKVSREAVLDGHLGCTMERCAGREFLAIQDTTFLNFTHLAETEGLGPIGTAEGLKGLVVHNTLAVELEHGDILGLLHQQVWAREGRKDPKETKKQRRLRERESQSWTRGVEAIRQYGLSEAIHVMDREGDIYEVLERLVDGKGRFVIRACGNRLLADSEEKKYLLETVRNSSPIGQIAVDVPARPGQAKRQAQLTLRRVRVTVRPSNALGRKGADLPIQVVEVHEEHPPKGCSALCWVLLTTEPTETVEDCIRVIKIYSRRWKIEEFHMGLKTGCHTEERQFQSRERLEIFLGLASIISVMMLRLRDAARRELTGGVFLTQVQQRLLRDRYRDLGPQPTVREIMRAVARLGGFLARKGDGEPGWRTLWRGMYALLLMEHGYLCAIRMAHAGELPA